MVAASKTVAALLAAVADDGIDKKKGFVGSNLERYLNALTASSSAKLMSQIFTSATDYVNQNLAVLEKLQNDSNRSGLQLLIMGLVIQLSILVVAIVAAANAGDMMRKSIVFNKNTPDVFYCPQKKSIGVDKMMVSAKPLKKLCEHEGKPLPAHYKSDCYNDVDETEYACKEKKRIMKRIKKEEEEKLEKAEAARASRSRRI